MVKASDADSLVRTLPLAASRRGQATIDALWMRWAGPLGLVWKQRRFALDRAIAVVPSLRAVTDLKALGERQITLDCDVLQADGGTRCASITGAWIALYEACEKLIQSGKLTVNPVKDHVAAISVGIFQGSPVLDLDYPEDSNCDTDMNVIMTGKGGIVEVQGTAEGEPFTREQMNVLMDLAQMGIRQLVAEQQSALAA